MLCAFVGGGVGDLCVYTRELTLIYTHVLGGAQTRPMFAGAKGHVFKYLDEGKLSADQVCIIYTVCFCVLFKL